jgi:ribonucleoside-diphosphate reductase alpha chain
MSNATPELRDTNEQLRYLFDEIRENGLRNMSITSIAPTGTISLIAETSSGIEPHFAYSYNRMMIKKDGEKEVLQVKPKSISGFSGYDEQVLSETGSLQEAYSHKGGEVPKTAQEISFESHIKMQAAVQAYISNSVSKTINLPNTATVKHVELAYIMAMKFGCKGITIYRDGSLSEQVLETKKVPERERELEGKTRVHRDNGMKTYVTVNFDDDGNPLELFISGETRVSVLLGRLGSLVLRGGINYTELVDQLRQTGGYASEIGDTINDIINGSNGHSDENWTDTNKGFRVNDNGETKCDVCGSINTVVMQDGCVSCSACAWAMCSA